jgi:hypothetical protein
LPRLPFGQPLDGKRALIKRATGIGMPGGRFPMIKHRVVCLFVTVAAGICLATAQTSNQNSQGSASAKSGGDPLKTATKPLTPKSAMPAPRKSSVAVPNTSKSGRNTTAELTHLERQNGKAGGSKSGTTPPAKGASVKPADKSAGSSSGINFKYQKPAGGLKAATPGPHSANSGTPRVKKN